MTIELINNTQERFTIIDKTITMDESLNLRDRGMMATLISFPPKWNFSVRGLAAIIPDGKDSITKSLQNLESKNYIIRQQIKDENGRFSKTRLIVNSNPQIPYAEKPLTDNPDTGKPPTENPQQLNNKEIKTKEINNKESITHSAWDAATVRDEVRDQIDYEAIKIDRKNDIKLLDLIVDLIVKVLIDDNEHIKIGGMLLPTDDVKQKFRDLNLYNIEFVIDRVRETKTRITNQSNYLISCLYRAEEQGDFYWDNIVKSTL